jgi:hypothetical protein
MLSPKKTKYRKQFKGKIHACFTAVVHEFFGVSTAPANGEIQKSPPLICSP